MHARQPAGRSQLHGCELPQDSTICCAISAAHYVAPMRAPAPGYAPAGSPWAEGCCSADSNMPAGELPTHTAALTVDRQPARSGTDGDL